MFKSQHDPFVVEPDFTKCWQRVVKTLVKCNSLSWTEFYFKILSFPYQT